MYLNLVVVLLYFICMHQVNYADFCFQPIARVGTNKLSDAAADRILLLSTDVKSFLHFHLPDSQLCFAFMAFI